MYEQDEEYMDEGEDGDEISNEIWQEVGPWKSFISQEYRILWNTFTFPTNLLY